MMNHYDFPYLIIKSKKLFALLTIHFKDEVN